MDKDRAEEYLDLMWEAAEDMEREDPESICYQEAKFKYIAYKKKVEELLKR